MPSASFHASPAGSTSNYHTVYAGFTTCAEDTMDLSSVTTVPTAVNVYQQELVRSPLTVAYCFLKGEDADYSGMAHAYRNYLTAGKEFAAVPGDRSLLSRGNRGDRKQQKFYGNQLYGDHAFDHL